MGSLGDGIEWLALLFLSALVTGWLIENGLMIATALMRLADKITLPLHTAPSITQLLADLEQTVGGSSQIIHGLTHLFFGVPSLWWQFVQEVIDSLHQGGGVGPFAGRSEGDALPHGSSGPVAIPGKVAAVASITLGTVYRATGATMSLLAVIGINLFGIVAYQAYFLRHAYADCPIVIDLDGDGVIKVTGDSTSWLKPLGAMGPSIYFDLDNDGFAIAEQIEWLAPENADGLLIDDRDGLARYGVTGARLMGNEGSRYAHGFDKLGQLFDANQDRKISGAELDGLKLWIDDGDGRIADNEIFTLQQFGIVALSLDMDEELLDRETSPLMQASVRTESGKPMMAEDVWFRVGPPKPAPAIADLRIAVMPVRSRVPIRQDFGVAL